ncbi:galactokinase-like [Culicoides brevitarsis]|uniref:galactokinase-like n=1 Tax=Culicoides brevitarsis TaxID=469753 RepID=UPI00307C3B6B
MATKLLSYDETLVMGLNTFRSVYLSSPTIVACAPGRVNLIGEHVDYNDGFVLPMALPMVTFVIGKPNGTDECEIVTCCEGADEPKRVRFKIYNLAPAFPKWANYMKGVIHHYGYPLQQGFNAVVITNVPIGGGLSSSAALEVATLKFMEAATGKSHPKLCDKALICQKAEHTFCDMPCGIMDQLISVAGKKDHAVLIDCQNLETTILPFQSKTLCILICNSNVKHELSSSEYPTRRAQCNKALAMMGLNSYKEAKDEHLQVLKKHDEVFLKRARHVITEIKRTCEAAHALKTNNFEKLGRLMNDSHASLRDDFEVSCKELDILVEIAQKSQGVLGSRMTGGGFGGCTVTLVTKTDVEKVIQGMEKEYQEKCGIKADFYVVGPSDGARLVDLNSL